MIIDIDTLDDLPIDDHYDVCIAGAGVAGITLAVSLERAGKRVLLLEAGGLEYSDVSQSLYQGKNVGRDYFDLDVTRLRYFGGTSNHWGGWCRPLDEYDFVKKDHIEFSGWPISSADLAPYLSETCKILEIDPFPDEFSLSGSRGKLKEVTFRYSPPVRFGEKYKDQLRRSELVDVFLNANLVDIELDAETSRISSFEFRGYTRRERKGVGRADHYVLALGGIENARMLLNSNKQIEAGLGNTNDLVGRYFMEHLHHDVGYYIVSGVPDSFGVSRNFLSPTPEFQSSMKIANAGYRLNPLEDWTLKKQVKDVLCYSDVIADLARTLRGRLNCMSPPVSAGSFRVASEQVPNFNSRVVLSDELDMFKLRKVEMDWQLLQIDKATILAGAIAIAHHFAEQDIGRIKLFDWLLNENESGIPGLAEGQEVGGHHHMGTTRMGQSSADGVVNSDGQVFGLNNLFVTGSSVFSTSGHTNPTFTIVQLALRLADQLANS